MALVKWGDKAGNIHATDDGGFDYTCIEWSEGKTANGDVAVTGRYWHMGNEFAVSSFAGNKPMAAKARVGMALRANLARALYETPEKFAEFDPNRHVPTEPAGPVDPSDAVQWLAWGKQVFEDPREV